MQDKAASHRAWVTTKMLEDENMKVSPWAAHFPDRNPMKTIAESCLEGSTMAVDSLRWLQLKRIATKRLESVLM